MDTFPSLNVTGVSFAGVPGVVNTAKATAKVIAGDLDLPVARPSLLPVEPSSEREGALV